MKRVLLALPIALLTPSASAAEASCGRLERCSLYFQKLQCLRYGDRLPAALTREEQARMTLRAAMQAQNCPSSSRREDEDGCEVALAAPFGEGEARDCEALVAAMKNR